MLKSNIRSLVFGIGLVGLAVSVFIVNQSFKSFTRNYEPLSPVDSAFFNRPYRIPDEVSFAGERVPLENFDTRESLDRELLVTAFRHSSTILIIKKANRYFPIIEKILRENNIPDDFKYLVAAESEFSNVVSPSGATGFWQIMAATGRELGMEINNVID